MKTYKLVILPGDGIGPEVMDQAVRLLSQVSSKEGFNLELTTESAGGVAIDQYGHPLPDEILERCKKAHAVLLGAVGGPKWDHLTGELRPESGLLKLRKSLGVFANLRPVSIPDSLAEASPLRTEIAQGTDLLVVRELTGGIYFGEPKGRAGTGVSEEGYNTMRYTAEEIERVTRIAFEWAKKRRGEVTSVDKANVLVVSQLWRDITTKVHREEFPHIKLSHMYVDNVAMQLVLNPKQFDVIVTGNLFGDILSDAAATLGGSLGLLPSASVGGPVGLFEPVHGSAPDIAGEGKANPIAMILSVSMMLDHLGESKAAQAIRTSVQEILATGVRTGDLRREGLQHVNTSKMGGLICERTLALL
ncbi:MAG: 3-isopropylmalate dehydrogenase [Kiritimatiellae bacterium]|nr:3-isopropylmalate dehydrogenase [Kiritimatiellia bacterium]